MTSIPITPSQKCLSFGEHTKEKVSRWEKVAQVARIIGIILLLSLTAAAVCALIGTGVGGIVAGSVGSAVILGYGAAGGAGFGILAGVSAFASVFGARRYKQPACTSALGLKEEKYGATPLGEYSSNDLLISSNPKEMKEFKLEFLRKAKYSLEISGNYVGGEMFRRGIENIRQAMRENPELRVRLMACTELIVQEDREAIESLKKEFPNRFHCLFCNFRLKTLPKPQAVEEHVKVIIVDEKYYTQGGTPLQDAFFRPLDEPPPKGRGFNDFVLKKATDMDAIGSGPAAKSLRIQYYNLWAKWAIVMGKTKTLENHYFPLPDDAEKAVIPKVDNHPRLKRGAPFKILVAGPEHARKDHNAIKREYIRMIDSAEKTIRIAHSYFSPPDDIMQALRRATARGVDVRVISNRAGKGANKSNWTIVYSSRLSYKKLILGRDSTRSLSKKEQRRLAEASTCQIFEYGKGTRSDVHLHKKVLAVDGKECIIGSYNLGQCSPHHDEIIFSIRDATLTAQLEEELAVDETFSTRVRFEDAKKYSGSLINKCVRFFISRFSG